MKSQIPSVTSSQMKRVDQLMVGQYHISMRLMMENAGRNLSELITEKYPEAKKVIAFAGAGGNGAGVLTACRHLISRGVHVVVVLTTIEAKQIPESVEEIKTLKRIGAGIMERDEFKPNMFSSFNLILDGMIGYQLLGKLRPNVARLCTYINESKLPVVSNDIPSGFHPDQGHINADCVHATYTLSIALPKPALLDNSWKGVYGHLYLGNIGVPPHLYRQMKLDVPEDLFGERNIIALS